MKFNSIQQEIVKMIKLINGNSKRKYVYVYINDFTIRHKIIDENDFCEIPLLAENEHQALYFLLGVWNEINKNKSEYAKKRNESVKTSRYGANDVLDDFAIMINKMGKKCSVCKRVTLNRYLEDDICPDCREVE